MALAALTLMAVAARLDGRPLVANELALAERDGDREAAASLALHWARCHAGEAASLPALRAFLRLERRLEALVNGIREIAVPLPDVEGAAGPLARAALILEASGLAEEAAALGRRSWALGGPPEMLARSMRLSLQMGDTGAVASVGAVDDPGIAAALRTLAARAGWLEGRTEEARQALQQALASGGSVDDRLAAAWCLFEIARLEGSATELAAAVATLADSFPASPESIIAGHQGTAFSEYPSPGLFLAGPPSQTPAGPRQDVQAGSFRVRENADELARDLQRAGFRPSVREGTLQGAAIWRVFAATALEPAAAAAVLEQLRAAGYAGIVVEAD